jgi:RimJ/RimL family protein N-acetyltransferase
MSRIQAAFLSLLVACSSPSAQEPSDLPSEELGLRAPSPWSESFEPPIALVTKRFQLEPLGPKHTDLDFGALMSSNAHLQSTLGWGGWPAEDFTAERDREDLEKHWAEFESRVAYAYTVLSPDLSECIGCVYINPLQGKEAQEAGLLYWVTESELVNGLDEHLLGALTSWMEAEWDFTRVELPVHNDNLEGQELALQFGFEIDDAGVQPQDGEQGGIMSFVWSLPGLQLFVWSRPE